MADWFVNTLSWWQWLVLAAVPPLIILLYFLKLRRRPLEVPSTYLWSRTVEDLHVNDIWQKLRQNLLLLLQLLFIALLAFALLRPGWQGFQFQQKHLVFLVDNSASMSASDVGPSRLEEAKKRINALIDQMTPEHQAMIVSFSETAKVVQTFTDNKNLLRAKLKLIEPTTHTSSLEEALRAASGIANPSRTGNQERNPEDVVTVRGIRTEMYILSDGGFRTIPNFSLGNLEPKYIAVGKPEAKNIAITAFSTERNPDKPGQLQAFARIENFSPDAATVEASLSLNGQLLDAQSVNLAAREERPGVAGVQFDLEDTEGILKVEINAKDNLAYDNSAYAVLNPPRPARVLVVSPGDAPYQRRVLETESLGKIAQVTFVAPSHLESKQYADDATSGVFDLIIYDRCVPPTPPQSNTLFIGRIPPFEGWPPVPKEKELNPTVIDIDRVHPLTQLMDMSNVRIVETYKVDPPKGGFSLIEGDVGPLYSVGPRQSFEDAALGFEIESSGDTNLTDWPKKRSFPLFFMNAIKYLGGVSSENSLGSTLPGHPYHIRTLLPVDRVTITTPDKESLTIPRELSSAIAFTQTDELGVYQVTEGTGTKVSQQFAVNLFDPRESDLLPADKIPIGLEQVQAETKTASESARKELWKWILLLGLGIVLFEWYVYNKRVYL